MYTQCNHCKAIFRVTMKELTAAQGLLRCGECDAIFDAMKSLSTTLPEERRFAGLSSAPLVAPEPATQVRREVIQPPKAASPEKTRPMYSARKFLIIGMGALVVLFLLQLTYTSRDWLAKQPLTAEATRATCEFLGCGLEVPHDPKKVTLLSHSVYSHPNSPDILTISLSIQNDATFAQAYPLVEISFLDKDNNTVALRRFAPTEYIKDFKHDLMPIGIPRELLLNIADPGKEAVRFQFRFM